MKILFSYLLICLLMLSCKNQKIGNEYLIRIVDTENDRYGYTNFNGDTVVPLGKYSICFTDTFKTYAIVSFPEKGSGFVCIDRDENIKYQVFSFDNGPDYISDGFFRIIENNKIGYADFMTGEIVIEPQFSCAFPFKDGVAKVTNSCEEKAVGEYSEWISDDWFYIDKSGKKVEKEK